VGGYRKLGRGGGLGHLELGETRTGAADRQIPHKSLSILRFTRQGFNHSALHAHERTALLHSSPTPCGSTPVLPRTNQDRQCLFPPPFHPPLASLRCALGPDIAAAYLWDTRTRVCNLREKFCGWKTAHSVAHSFGSPHGGRRGESRGGGDARKDKTAAHDALLQKTSYSVRVTGPQKWIFLFFFRSYDDITHRTEIWQEA
jgi:hypothetical protein